MSYLNGIYQDDEEFDDEDFYDDVDGDRMFTEDDYWDLYTDAAGNCFSDADPGL